MKTKMNQKIIEQLNERMETKSNIQTCCLEKKMKQKEMNDEWLKEKHWFNEVHLNQQNLSNEELTILMIVKIVWMTIRRI